MGELCHNESLLENPHVWSGVCQEVAHTVLRLRFIQQKNVYIYIYIYIKFIQQRSYVNIFLFEVGLLQLPLSPPQKLNTLRLLGSIIK